MRTPFSLHKRTDSSPHEPDQEYVGNQAGDLPAGQIASIQSWILSLALLFAVVAATGWIMGRSYQPVLGEAYKSVMEIRETTWLGVARNVHYWGSAFLIAASLFIIVTMVVKGRVVRQTTICWYAAVAIFACSMALQITGNLLPTDRHDVQTAVVEGGVASQVPLIGDIASQFLYAGAGFGQPTLSRWSWLHQVMLPIVSLIFPVALLLLALFGPWRPTWKRASTYGLLVGVVILSLFVDAPWGAEANASDYARFDARPSWYVWAIHGTLSMFRRIDPSLGFIGSVLLPSLFVLLLVGAPLVVRKWGSGALRKSFLTICVIFALGGVGFGGSFAPLVGTQDPPYQAEVPAAPKTIPIDPKLFAAGKKLFLDEGCGGCHGIDGSKSTAAPDLTHVGARFPDPKWYAKFIRNPRSVRPNTIMPPFPDLTDAQVSALADYLRAPRQ